MTCSMVACDLQYTQQCHVQVIDKVAACVSLTVCCVTDSTKPVIACPDGVIYVELGTSEPIGATGEDASGEPTIECTDTSTLPIGIKKIRCTATDASDNERWCYADIMVEGAIDSILRHTACDTGCSSREEPSVLNSTSSLLPVVGSP